jgi:hypothetical protein
VPGGRPSCSHGSIWRRQCATRPPGGGTGGGGGRARGARRAGGRGWARLARGPPRRAVDCFETLYGRPIGASEYGLALAEAVGHLNRLLHAGEAVREPAPDGAWLWRRSRKGA